MKDILSLEAVIDQPRDQSYYERKQRLEKIPKPFRVLTSINGTNPYSHGPFRFGIGGGERVTRSTRIS